ncbi:MAG: hypothetical protein M3483_08270, partial [Gemmatimonadota bacterium]|nr:hypothetical protein [Gemmatimonadota bacterium]
MMLYRRVLGYLGPHRGLFAVAVGAMTVHAALDALSFTLVIPFLNVLFRGEVATGAVGAFGGGDAGGIHRFLDAVVGPFIRGRSPMAALRNVVLFLFTVFLVKNLALYAQNYTVKMVQGRVTRDLRNE